MHNFLQLYMNGIKLSIAALYLIAPLQGTESPRFILHLMTFRDLGLILTSHDAQNAYA